jgi:hypothetical protein
MHTCSCNTIGSSILGVLLLKSLKIQMDCLNFKEGQIDYIQIQQIFGLNATRQQFLPGIAATSRVIAQF